MRCLVRKKDPDREHDAHVRPSGRGRGSKTPERPSSVFVKDDRHGSVRNSHVLNYHVLSSVVGGGRPIYDDDLRHSENGGGVTRNNPLPRDNHLVV